MLYKFASIVHRSHHSHMHTRTNHCRAHRDPHLKKQADLYLQRHQLERDFAGGSVPFYSVHLNWLLWINETKRVRTESVRVWGDPEMRGQQSKVWLLRNRKLWEGRRRINDRQRRSVYRQRYWELWGLWHLACLECIVSALCSVWCGAFSVYVTSSSTSGWCSSPCLYFLLAAFVLCLS